MRQSSRRRQRPAALALGAAVLATSVTACSASSGGQAATATASPATTATASPPSATASAPSPSLSSAAPSGGSPSRSWAVLVDERSGVTFALPERVAPQTRDQQLPGGGAGQARVYQVEVDGVGVAVSILVGDNDLSGYDAKAVLNGLVAGLKQAGAKDAKVSAVRTSTMGGRKAVEGTLTFTSSKGQSTYWRMRTAVTARAVVSVQALVFADPATISDATRQVDEAFDVVTQGVTFP